MIEQACAGTGPEGLLFGDGGSHMRNSGSQGWFANAVKRAQPLDHPFRRLPLMTVATLPRSSRSVPNANVKAA